jgi:hypothetical protein
VVVIVEVDFVDVVLIDVVVTVENDVIDVGLACVEVDVIYVAAGVTKNSKIYTIFRMHYIDFKSRGKQRIWDFTDSKIHKRFFRIFLDSFGFFRIFSDSKSKKIHCFPLVNPKKSTVFPL